MCDYGRLGGLTVGEEGYEASGRRATRLVSGMTRTAYGGRGCLLRAAMREGGSGDARQALREVRAAPRAVRGQLSVVMGLAGEARVSGEQRRLIALRQ